MKRILCYGDSNTWGVIPKKSSDTRPSNRYPETIRWPQVMWKDLGADWQLIEEGLGGRTSIYQVPGEAYRLGDAYLAPCLLSHRPLDYLIIMLGTNDLQPKFHTTEITGEKLSHGFEKLAEIVQSLPECGISGNPPRLLMVSPPPIKLSQIRPDVSEKYGREKGVILSKMLPEIISFVAARYQADFLDASRYSEASEIDGIHFTKESHLQLGHAIAKKIKELELSKKSTSNNTQPPYSSLRSDIEM